MLTARWIHGPAVFEAWADRWRELFAAARNATPFQSLEWQSVWARRFAGSEPSALAILDGEELAGWWPLVRGGGLWPTLRAAGGGPSDYLHPLIRAGCAGVERAFAEALVELRPAPLLDLHQLRDDFAGELRSALPGSALPQSECLVLELPESYDRYLQALGKSLRYDVRRLDKAPFATGEARIDLVEPDALDGGLDLFFRLHARRWRRRGQPGAFPRALREFHREWAAVSGGCVRLSILSLKGEPVGAMYAMTLAGTTYFYQAGMDPSAAAISPGSLLVASAIRAAIERGDRNFDFLRGDEPYKRRWMPQSTRTTYRCLGASERRPALDLGVRWNRFGHRLEGRIRARLEGRSAAAEPNPPARRVTIP